MADFATTNSKFHTVVNVDGNFVPRSLRNEFYLPPTGGLLGAVKADGTTTTIDSDGTIHARGSTSAGVTGLAGTPLGQFLVGQIRLLAGPNIQISEDTGDNTITFAAIGTGSASQVEFVSAAVGSSGQTFNSQVFLNYLNNPANMTLTVNGVVMTPLRNYILTGSVLTVLDYLSPNAIIQVTSKTTGGGGGGSGSSTITGLPVTGIPQPLNLIQVNESVTSWQTTPQENLTDGGNF